jgi:hypothetical protein
MKTINQVPVTDLVFQLRKLSNAAKEVAYADSNTEAEYFTINHLRPLIEQTELLLLDKEVQK